MSSVAGPSGINTPRKIECWKASRKLELILASWIGIDDDEYLNTCELCAKSVRFRLPDFPRLTPRLAWYLLNLVESDQR